MRRRTDRRQRFEREDKQKFLAGVQRDVAGASEIAENKFRALVRKTDEADDECFRRFKSLMDERHFEHEQRENDLQRDAPADGAPVHGAEIGGKHRHEAEETKHAGESLPARADRALRQIRGETDGQNSGGNPKNATSTGLWVRVSPFQLRFLRLTVSLTCLQTSL